MISHPFDEQGKEIQTSLSERLIGLNIADLVKLKECVLIAGGEAKRKSILAALQGKWVDVLITDEKTAGWLIQHDKERE